MSLLLGRQTFQPRTRRSKPHENKLQEDVVAASSVHATEETIRRCPCRVVRGSLATRCPFKSNRRIWRLSCGIAIIPFGDMANRFTAESVRIVAKAERMFLSSHTFTVLSSEPDTTLSSRVNTVEVTLLEKDRWKLALLN